MLKDIGVLSKNALVVIIYTDDNYLTYYIRNKINKENNVVSNYVVDVNKKNIKSVDLDISVKPLVCDKWVLYYDSEIFSTKELLESMQKVSFHALKVFYIRDYKVYKKIVKGEVLKSLGVYAKSFYFGVLQEKDIDYLYKDLVVSKGYEIDKDILRVIKKDYSRSVSSIFTIFQEVVSGNELATKEDLIDLVGLGNNNVAKFLVNSYLRIVESKNEKKAVYKVLKELNYMSKVIEYRNIKSMIKWVLEGFIEIKLLQIMGVYKKAFISIPEGVNKKRLDYLRLYDWFVLNRVSLYDLLCMLEDVKRMSLYNDEVELIRFIFGLVKYKRKV